MEGEKGRKGAGMERDGRIGRKMGGTVERVNKGEGSGERRVRGV